MNHQSLIDQADHAMVRGDVAKAASLLELAAQRGRDASILLRLATVRRSMGDLHGAAAAALAAVELAPRHFLMALLLGSLREATGAVHGAVRAYRGALQYAPLDLSHQPGIKAQLDHARRCVEAEDEWSARLHEWDPDRSAARLDEPERKRMRGFRANILENLVSGPVAPPKFNIPGIPARTFFDAGEFVGVDDVAAQSAAIRDEFLALVEAGPEQFAGRMAGLHSAGQETGSSGQWSMIPLIRNGAVVEEFASRCPATMAAAAKLGMARIGMISPSLYFSTLEPGAHIPAHTGISNARAIAHFPLLAPAKCRFRVGDESRAWAFGEPMIFDDMTMHEAWNEGSELRAVLIADLWRPELSTGERVAVEELMRFDMPAAPQAVAAR